jgi:CheY-like chemotaxis protein
MNEVNFSNKNDSDNLKDNIQRKEIKSIETYSLTAMLVLLLSVILMLFNHSHWAAVLIIAVVALKIMVLRRTITLNERLETLITLLLISEKKKVKIISEFSRKIRGPLNNLIITEDLLTEVNFTAKQKEFVETIKASAKSMASVANELTMAVAENMNIESRKHIQFNIGSAIEHVIELYTTESKKNLDIKFVKAEAANIECIDDPIIIKQIFIDLFDRIEKQNKDRKVTIKISLSFSEESSSENIIAIVVEADTKTPLVVETNTESSITVKLISLMKGKYIQSFDDNSVSLTMSLKIKKPVQTSKEKLSSPKIEEPMNKEQNDKDMKDLRVLLVEDNIMNRKIIQLALKPLVQSVDLASDGKEALDKFAMNTYDIILMDVEMPVMDGLMATEKIRTLEATTNKHVPIIAITANAMIDDMEKCLSSGADDYISKPFQSALLVEKIKRLI